MLGLAAVPATLHGRVRRTRVCHAHVPAATSRYHCQYGHQSHLSLLAYMGLF